MKIFFLGTMDLKNHSVCFCRRPPDFVPQFGARKRRCDINRGVIHLFHNVVNGFLPGEFETSERMTQIMPAHFSNGQ